MSDNKPTPSSDWYAAGEKDPHDGRYNCERHQLTMSTLSDDALANGAFLSYDRWPPIQDVISGKAHPPTAWMTAVKDRIRWLSRRLQRLEDASAKTWTQAEIEALAIEHEDFGLGMVDKHGVTTHGFNA